MLIVVPSSCYFSAKIQQTDFTIVRFVRFVSIRVDKILFSLLFVGGQEVSPSYLSPP